MLSRIRKFTLVVLVVFLFSFFPGQTARAETVDTAETWTTDRTLDGNLEINENGHLTIASGVTITFECAMDIMDSYYIFVNPGGQLTADGVTFQGDGTAGCWRGIFVQSQDNQTVIENSVIRDAWMGVTIWQSSPTISNNEIYNLTIPDEVTPNQSFYAAVGIKVEGPDFVMEPIIQNNYIHHITGGAGADGTDGADATEPGMAGEEGGAGENGGSVVGIYIGDENANVLIQGNRIEYLIGGACGVGGDGGDGAAGVDGEAGSLSAGGMGGDGGQGGTGGTPGLVYGINSYGAGNTRIIDNEIAYLFQAPACTGGDGGMGGPGGRGGDADDVSTISGAQGGTGGNGGSGGSSSIMGFGIVGIQVQFPWGEEDTHDTISRNVVHDIYAADGVVGGAGQTGGLGGVGGNGYPDSVRGVADGGSGGYGGQGGNGGASRGGHGAGIYIQNVSLSIESNTIYNINGGDASDAGSAGDGGTGGDGGVGGYYSLGEVYGNGGQGGPGGSGGQGGGPYSGGYAGGIYVGGEGTLSVEIYNNDIWGIYAGMAGDAGLSGIGGMGGAGGNTLVLSEATGGNGGDGGQGGPDGSGGNAGRSILVMLDYANGSVYNNTLVDATAFETGGADGSGGPGGAGGLGGLGGSNGLSGSEGSVGPDDNGPGTGGMAVGVWYENTGESLTDVFNNILYLTDPTPANTYAIWERNQVLASLDYNDIYGWEYPNSVSSNGVNSIFTDPLFVSATDHNLLSGSPSIDMGTNTGAPGDDITGKIRPIDGDGNETEIVDMGAYEAGISEFLIFLPLLLK